MSLGLLGAYSSSSSSSDNDSDEEKDIKEKIDQQDDKEEETLLSNPFSDKNHGNSTIPKPSFMVETEDLTKNKPSVSTSTLNSSVFNNPFRDKEDKKRAILEKHVEMTTKQEELKTINGKKVCWNFRKGRCRFGHKSPSPTILTFLRRHSLC